MGDRYVLNGGLITAGASFPSKYLDRWIKEVDPPIRDLMMGLGIKNGVISFQALPEGDKIYVYECCFRLTGGMTYKMTDAVSGHNSFKLLLNYSLTGEMGNESDASRIDPTFHGQKGLSMTIPLRIGKIGSVEGVDGIRSLRQVVDYTQYYKIGDSIGAKCINTLDQLFARIMFVGDSMDSLVGIMSRIRALLKIKDERGENMVIWDTFDNLYAEFKSNDFSI